MALAPPSALARSSALAHPWVSVRVSAFARPSAYVFSSDLARPSAPLDATVTRATRDRRPTPHLQGHNAGDVKVKSAELAEGNIAVEFRAAPRGRIAARTTYRFFGSSTAARVGGRSPFRRWSGTGSRRPACQRYSENPLSRVQCRRRWISRAVPPESIRRRPRWDDTSEKFRAGGTWRPAADALQRRGGAFEGRLPKQLRIVCDAARLVTPRR